MKHSVQFLTVALAAVLAGCSGDDTTGPTPTICPAVPTDFDAPDRLAVFEYTPAPGQFINEGMDGVDTPDKACRWAEERLGKGEYVSLGGFGGYIVMGLGHAVKTDFKLVSNAFLTSTGGSSEPGIVYVMADENANGLPDDTWYELRGADHDSPATIHDYAVTYFRPDGDGKSVDWTDNRGNSGQIKYIRLVHKQPSYYPAWVEAESYTLAGTCLAYDGAPKAWGYADNMGNDTTAGSAEAATTTFSIANAVDAEGNAANLSYIHFVKVMTGVNANNGALGEISTEVCGFSSK